MFKKLFKNSIIYSLSPLSSKLVGFVLLPIYTSYFTVADYGVLGILEVTSLFTITVFGFGLYWAFNRWYWDKEYADSQKSMFFTLIVFLALSSLLLFLIFAFYAESLAQFLLGNIEFKRLLQLMLIASFLEILGRIPLTLMKLQEKPFLFSATNILKFSIVLVGTILFIIKLDLGLEGIFIAQILGAIGYLLALLPYIIKNSSPRLEFRLLKEMLLFSLPLMAASISGIVLSITDRYSLKFLSDLNSVGLYALGFKMANSIKIFIANSIQMAVSPIVYKKMNDADNGVFYASILRYFGFVVLFFVVVLSVFSQELIQLLATDSSYWQAAKLVPIIGLAIVFGVMKDSVAVGIHLKKRTNIMAVIVTEIAIINLILNILLIPKLDYLGAAIATVFSQIIYFILVYIKAQKIYRIPFNLKMTLVLAGSGMIILSPLFFIDSIMLEWRLPIKCGLVILYPFILYKIGYFEPKIINEMKNIISKMKIKRG